MAKSALAKQYEKRCQLAESISGMDTAVLISVCHVLSQFSKNTPDLVEKNNNQNLDKSQVKNLEEAAIIMGAEYDSLLIGEGNYSPTAISNFICKFDETYSQKIMPNIRDLDRKVFDKAVEASDVSSDFTRTLSDMHLYKASFVLRRSKQKYDHNS